MSVKTISLFGRTQAELVSRSEARRLLVALDRFRTVVFDFERVVAVGPSFADEIFRVWRAEHPDIVVRVENANDDVAFMIRRAGFSE